MKPIKEQIREFRWGLFWLVITLWSFLASYQLGKIELNLNTAYARGVTEMATSFFAFIGLYSIYCAYKNILEKSRKEVKHAK